MNNQLRKPTINILRYWCIIIFINVLFFSCDDDFDSIVPGNGNDAYINFYNAMEVTFQSNASDSLAYDNYIYVNDSVASKQFHTFPQFSESYLDDGRQYPSHFTGSAPVVDIAGGSGGVYWMPIMSDTYKFIFTSRQKTFLADTSVTLAPKSYLTQYLTESPASDTAYTIISVPVELKEVKGKVQIQIVNLSPDWGAIDVYQVDANDTEIASELPSGLSFGNYSEYAELDINKANSNKKLVLKFRKQGEEDARLTTTISAISGSSYILLVKGFIGEATRYVKKNNNEYISVEITPNLRIETRRIY